MTQIADPGSIPPLTLLACIEADDEATHLDGAFSRLEDSDLRLVHMEPAPSGGAQHAWNLDLELESALAPSGSFPAQAWCEAGWQLSDPNSSAPEQLFTLGLRAPLVEPVLQNFHGLIRLLAALAPDSREVFDPESERHWDGQWLIELAQTRVPPSPRELYSHQHVNASDETPGRLETQGLMRIGLPEICVLNVSPNEAELAIRLLDACVDHFFFSGVPEPASVFRVGPAMEVFWEPWAPENGAVQAPPRMAIRSPNGEGATQNLSLRPALYVSPMENERMSLLASERLPRFLRLLREHRSGTCKFLVRLGCPIEGTTTHEQLWFEAHTCTGCQLETTLISQPESLKLQPGQRSLQRLDFLSDWAIETDRGSYGAADIGSLERLLRWSPELH